MEICHIMESKNKKISKRFIEEIINTENTENISEFINESYIDHNDKNNKVTGINGAVSHINSVRNTYPDLVVTVEHQIAEGNYVVSRIVGRATHQGEWMGMKPTNKPIVIEAVNIDRIENGKIIEHWGMANSIEALIEVGAFPVK